MVGDFNWTKKKATSITCPFHRYFVGDDAVILLACDLPNDDELPGFVLTPPNKDSQVLSFLLHNAFPARCYIKQSKLYIDYQGDDQCTQEEIYDGCTTFPKIDCHLRKGMTSTSNKDYYKP